MARATATARAKVLATAVKVLATLKAKARATTRKATAAVAGLPATTKRETEPTSCGEGGGCGEVFDAPGDEAERADTDAKWTVITHQAAAIAAKAGDVPGYWQGIIEKRKTQTQDWRDVMREYLRCRRERHSDLEAAVSTVRSFGFDPSEQPAGRHQQGRFHC